MAAKAYKGGQKEGKAVIYRANSYPYHAIGPVQFLWQACLGAAPTAMTSEDKGSIESGKESEEKKLWIFCHPAITQEVHVEVEKAIMSICDKQIAQDVPVEAAESESESAAKELEAQALKFPKVSLRSLKDELVRFRLLGPRSHALLMETLKPALEFPAKPSRQSTEEQELIESPVNTTDLPDITQWWENLDELRRKSEAIASCYGALKCASSPLEFSRGAVVGMTVLDPRLYTPSRRTDMVSAFYPSKKPDWERCRRRGAKERRKQHDHASEVSDSESSGSEESEVADLSEDEAVEEEEDNVDSNHVPADLDAEKMIESLSEEELEKEPPTIKSNALLQLPILPQAAAYSPIWDEGIRKVVSASRTPEHLLNKLRSTQLVRSSTLKLGGKAARIPVLLVQQSLQAPPFAPRTPPRSSQSSTACKSQESSDIGIGWDLILPANWATAFWVALIYRGARACGMRELKRCSLEALVPHFPEDFPDTEAGQKHDDTLRQALVEKYLRRPPDKRRNYGKLLIPSPFHCPWEEVVKKWGRESRIQPFLMLREREEADNQLQPQPPKRPRVDTDPVYCPEGIAVENGEPGMVSGGGSRNGKSGAVEQRAEQVSEIGDLRPKDKAMVVPQSDLTLPPFYLLRSRETLSRISHFLLTLFATKLRSGINCKPFSHQSASPDFWQVLRDHGIDCCLQQHTSALVPVKLEMLRRGTVGERAMLCLPSPADLTSLVNDKSFQGPEEEIHPKGVTVAEDGVVHIGMTSLTLREFRERRKEMKTKASASKSQGK